MRMCDLQLAQGLQERAARAFPAEHVTQARGWWLRHAGGCGWWVGAVLPHGDAGPDALARRVDGAEKFYADHGVAARFQISPGVCPAGLDDLLAARGYRRHGVMSLQVAPTAQVPDEAPPGAPWVRLDDRPPGAWLATWHTVHGGDARAERAMLERVQRPSAYVCAVVGDDVVAVGRAVADAGWAGVFGMATRPEARGRGAARAVLAALGDWARVHGAPRMYLQVERDNAPALRLYERTGFSELCAYHYRAAA